MEKKYLQEEEKINETSHKSTPEGEIINNQTINTNLRS